MIPKMIPNLIWAPDFFGPQELWSLANLVPKKFGLPMKIIIWHFYVGTKSLGAPIFRGSNFLGTKFLKDHISWEPKKSGA